jgi:hypothetical protein
MNRLAKLALGGVMMLGATVGTVATTTVPANAGVSVGIGIGVPGPVVAPVYPAYPANCWNYNYWYQGCSYPTYAGGVWIGGRWYYGPHYYRYWGGRPWVWWHGGWHGYDRGGWGGWHGYAGYHWGHGGWHR